MLSLECEDKDGASFPEHPACEGRDPFPNRSGSREALAKHQDTSGRDMIF